MQITELEAPPPKRRRGAPCKPDAHSRTISFKIPPYMVELLQEYQYANRMEWSEALRYVFFEGMRLEGLL